MNREQRRAAGLEKDAVNGASISELFAEAVRQHQSGQGFEAEALCRAVLARDGAHAGSLHLLGVIAMQRGLFDEAVVHFRKAAESRPDIAIGHHNLGKALAATGRVDAAVVAFKEALAVKPDFAEAHKDTGVILMTQGKFREASACFARTLELVPELAENFADTSMMLRKVNPALGEAAERAAAVWPRVASADELLGAPGLAAIADDPMLLRVLTTMPIRDPALEWLLTAVRADLLRRAAAAPVEVDENVLGLSCALARQCFNNEYVFSEGSDEIDVLERLSAALADSLERNLDVPPLWLAAVASYRPLSMLSGSHKLLDRTWPNAADQLLTQQIRQVDEEQRIREAIPSLTAIDGEIADAVRKQYEENPYPRWVAAPSPPAQVTVDEYLLGRFPLSPFRPLGDRSGLDILIAGCGTGEHSIGTARRYRDTRVLAIDLSLSSLSYAQRKTRELGVQNVEYAQADILALGSIGRSFDVIDASGVLHHLRDPMAGWRQLFALLRPGGLMRVGLYSELGRAEIVAAHRFIAEHGFNAAAASIRSCRQAMLATPLRALTKYADFFNTSGCRDLLFHVQEHRLTIAQIKEFLVAQGLAFVGFELDAATLQSYRTRYSNDRSMTDLDTWDAFERERPGTFSGMYQFWCQRA